MSPGGGEDQVPGKTRIGPYEIEGELGRGGMGEVLLAHDPRLERHVALKRIRADTDRRHTARLQREARTAARLRHPALVQVYDFLEVDKDAYIVMEYVAGTTLRQKLREHGPAALAHGLELARHLTEGLAYAHHRGVIHRDLKSENVLLGEDGEVKLADFGIARSTHDVGSTVTREGAIVGTPRCMAPEVLRGEPATVRSDLFSLGVLLYELFAAVSPFAGDTEAVTVAQVLAGQHVSLRQHRPDLPVELIELVEALLETDPNLRPRDTDEVVVTLRALARDTDEVDEETLIAGTTRAATISALPPHSAQQPSPQRMIVMALLLVVRVVVAVVLIWFLWSLTAPDTRAPEPAAPPVSRVVTVAVPEPVVEGGHAAGDRADGVIAEGLTLEEAAALRFAVRHNLLRALSSLDGIVIKANEEVDAVSGAGSRSANPLPSQLARALDADEILTCRLHCGQRDCQAQMQRIAGPDASVILTEQVLIPRQERLLAARALAAAVQRLYPQTAVQPGEVDLKLSADDYARYLDMERAQGESPQGDRLQRLLQEAEELRRRSPDFVDIYRLEARLAQRRFTETRDPALLDHAVSLLDQAARRQPGDLSIHLQRVSLELQAERPEAAQAILDDLFSRYPTDVRLLDQRAYLLETQGRLSEALDLRRQAAERSPSWRRLYNAARLAARMGQTDRARAWLELLLERSPDNRRGLALLASLALQQGNFERAATGYEALVAQEPRLADRSNLALCYLYLGQLDDAARQLRVAVEAAPQNPFYRLNLADVYLLQGELDAASVLYRDVVELATEDPGAPAWQLLSVRAQALAHLGRASEAVAAAQEVLRRAPEEAWAAFEASVAYALAGERLTARAEAERAQRLGIAPPWFDLPWFQALAAGETLGDVQKGSPPGSSSGGS